MSDRDALRDVVEELKSFRKFAEQSAGRKKRPSNCELKEAAERLGVRPAALAMLVRTGRIFPVVVRAKSGRSRLVIPLSEIRQFVMGPPRRTLSR